MNLDIWVVLQNSKKTGAFGRILSELSQKSLVIEVTPVSTSVWQRSNVIYLHYVHSIARKFYNARLLINLAKSFLP